MGVDEAEPPAAGLLTRAQAEARLQRILSGQDESVPLKPPPGSQATFGMAAGGVDAIRRARP